MALEAPVVPAAYWEVTPMNDRLIKKLKKKNGMTILEVVVAVCILALVVTAGVMVVSLSHSTVLSQSSSANAAAQAQELADKLITELHGKTPEEVNKMRTFDGAINIGRLSKLFPDATSVFDKQFIIEYVDKDGIEGYKIRTAVYYTDSNGRKCVQMQAFSAKDGG